MRVETFKAVLESVAGMTEAQLDQLVAAVEQRRARTKALSVNLSQAAEVGAVDSVPRKRDEVWLAENRPALESSNAVVEAHGLPLTRYRNF